ncbi:MAG: class I SAM-dependent DNA methyltransferase [Phycisphaerales bacterium]
MEETAVVPPSAQSAASLKPLLQECGYTGARLERKYRLGNIEIPLVGFATGERDMDSACIAVVDGGADPVAAVRSCYELAAPVVWVRHNGTAQWWIQKKDNPERFEPNFAGDFTALVRKYKDKLDPISIYQGRTLARINPAKQLDFVDAGLLPLRREEAGKKLHDTVESMIDATRKAMKRPNPSRIVLRDIFTSVFRMLAGKILKDKGIGGFPSVDLSNPKALLHAVAAHYDTTNKRPAAPTSGYDVLKEAAALLSQAVSFAVVSPESLAYVYEHTLVSRDLRKKLGIHATPPWLVDYMVWQLYDWVRDMDEDDRHVFEPACGHAPFLLSMMRLLRMEMHGKTDKAVHAYLKNHIHGVEIDDFAREIARLSLTLADIPNPNGWDLQPGDMFESDVLMREAKRCRILLSNPPYEKFDYEDQARTKAGGYPAQHKKAVELLHRTLEHLPVGAAFAVVVPQAVVNGSEAESLRTKLLPGYELSEVCRFPGKVFEFAEMETAVIIGRRVADGSVEPRHRVRQRIVGEHGMAAFRDRYATDVDEKPLQARFAATQGRALSVPQLDEVWEALERCNRLHEIAKVGRGIEYKSEEDREGVPVEVDKPRAGYPAGFAGKNRKHPIFAPLPECGLATRPELIANPRQGLPTGQPTILVRRTRASRSPWRIKAFLDPAGKPAKNNFLVVRSERAEVPPLFLWALLNSPIANAFMARDTMQRDNADGDLADIPMPPISSAGVAAVVAAATRYCEVALANERAATAKAALRRKEAPLFESEAADAPSTVGGDIRMALLELDAAVLRLYGLPLRLERQLLDFFRKKGRPDVGCTFGDYFPAEFKSLVPLHKYISAGYRGSTVDQVAARMKPDGSSAGTAALRAAAEAFGVDQGRPERLGRALALLDKWTRENADFDARVGPQIERALRETAPRHFPES